MTRFILIYFFLLNFSCRLFGQQPDAHGLLGKAIAEYSKIRDFSAHAEIIVNVDFINIPDKYATVFYKYPDRYRFKSKGFIMIPKKGLNFSLNDILNQPAVLVYSGKSIIDGISCDEIKIIPDDPQSEVVLANVYIEPSFFYVKKLEANTRKSGSYSVMFYYNQHEFALPDSIKINFDVEKLHFPLKFMANIDVDDQDNQTKNEGSVTIKYTDYKINIGVSDDVFTEEDKRDN
jgi:hypothetical protein